VRWGGGRGDVNVLCTSYMRCSDDPEKAKNAPQIFQGFQHQKVAWHCGKITIFEKKNAFYKHGFRSGGMFLFINMLQAVRIRILLAMVIVVSSTHFPQKISAILGSLGDPENPEMKNLTNFIVRAAWGRARMMLASMMTRANMVACRLHCRANPPDQARAGGA